MKSNVPLSLCIVECPFLYTNEKTPSKKCFKIIVGGPQKKKVHGANRLSLTKQIGYIIFMILYMEFVNIYPNLALTNPFNMCKKKHEVSR